MVNLEFYSENRPPRYFNRSVSEFNEFELFLSMKELDNTKIKNKTIIVFRKLIILLFSI